MRQSRRIETAEAVVTRLGRHLSYAVNISKIQVTRPSVTNSLRVFFSMCVRVQHALYLCCRACMKPDGRWRASQHAANLIVHGVE